MPYLYPRNDKTQKMDTKSFDILSRKYNNKWKYLSENACSRKYRPIHLFIILVRTWKINTFSTIELPTLVEQGKILESEFSSFIPYVVFTVIWKLHLF